MPCEHKDEDAGYEDDGKRHTACCLGCGTLVGEREQHSWENDVCSVCKAAAVAEVGDKKFSTLGPAFDEALDTGNEITLIADITSDEYLEVCGNPTINGGGHTITFKYNSTAGAIIVRNRSLTLNNVNVQAAEGYEIKSVISCEDGAKLNITNCTISGGKVGIYAVNRSEGTDGVVEATGSTISGKDCGLYFLINVKAEIKNCKISGNIGVHSEDYDNTFVIDGGTITATDRGIYIAYNNKVVITGGCQIIKSGDSGNGTGIRDERNAQSVSLEDCTITGFANAISTPDSKPVSGYLAENCYYWNREGNIITDTNVDTISGDVSIHPCTHGDNKFTDNGDTHTGSCAICNKVDITDEPHTYNSKGICTVCGSKAKIKADNSSTIYYTNSIYDAVSKIDGIDITITLLDNIALTEDLVLSSKNYYLDLNGKTISGEGFKITGDTAVLTVRSSNGGSIECDVKVLDFSADGNPELGNVTADNVTISGKGVQIKALTVSHSGQLSGGSYGYISLGDGVTFAGLLNNQIHNEVYYAYYQNDKPVELASLTDKGNISNVTVKRCNHGAYEYSLVKDEEKTLHKGSCKYCGFNLTEEEHKFIEAETPSGEKRTATATCICGAELTFTLGDKEYIYNGDVQKPTVTGKITLGNTTIELAENDYNLTYYPEDNYTNAGLHKVEVNCNFGSNNKYELSFNIEKAEPFVKWENTTVTYTGEQAVIARPEIHIHYEGEIAYSYASEGTNTFTEGIPVNAGVYTLKAVITETENFKAGEITSKLTINKENGSLTVDNTIINKTYGDPNFAIEYDKTGDGLVSFTSSNEDVATVDKKTGEVTITGAGKCTITVKLADGTNYIGDSEEITLNVAQAQGAFTVPKEITKTYGDKEFTITPTNKVGDGEFSFTSSSDKIATVDKTGKVTIVSAGKCTITVKLADGTNYTGADSQTITLNVAQAQGSFTVPKEINKTYGDKDFTITPTDKVGDGEFTFESNNSDVATVDKATGEVTIKGAGECTITVTLAEGTNYTGDISKEITLTVKQANGSLTVANTKINKTFGNEKFTIEYKKTGDGLVSFVSSKEDVATVDEKTGEVTIVGAGECTITVTLADGTNYIGDSEEITLNVAQAQGALTVPEKIEKTFGNQNFTIEYDTTGDGLVSFTSSNDKVATVDKNGNVTIKGAGECTITVTLAATTNYKGDSKKITLIVNQANGSFDIDTADISKTYGDDSFKLTPTNIVGGAVSYLSSDEDVATVDEKGNATIVGAGECTITVTLAETDNYKKVSKTIKLTVAEKPNTPDNPEDSETPDNPEDLETPDNPEDSETPDNPEDSETPDNPEDSETPDNPEDSETPDNPEDSETPDNPEDSETPDNPEDSETPDNPEDSDTPDTPPAPEKPFIKGDSETTGWDVIREAEDKAENGDVINVDMNGTSVVPGDIFDKIKGEDTTIIFDLGGGITWTVNGKDITSDKVSDINFAVNQNSSNIPVDVVNNVTGERSSLQLSLAYDGEFGFTAVLSVNLGKSNAGYVASLYYYDLALDVLEFICKDTISENGKADLTFTHASDYLIVIDEKSDDSSSDISDNSDSESSGSSSDSDSGNNSGESSDESSGSSSDSESGYNSGESSGNSIDSNSGNNSGDSSDKSDASPDTGIPQNLSWIIMLIVLLGAAIGGTIVAARKKRI